MIIFARVRKRVNLSVTPNEYRRLSREAKFHGFRGPCQLVLTMVRLCLRMMDRPREEEPDEEYIYHLFDAMAHSERQPDGDVPVTRWRKNDGQE